MVRKKGKEKEGGDGGQWLGMVKMRHRNEPQNEVVEFELKGVDEGEAKSNHFTMNEKTSATANSAQYLSQILVVLSHSQKEKHIQGLPKIWNEKCSFAILVVIGPRLPHALEGNSHPAFCSMTCSARTHTWTTHSTGQSRNYFSPSLLTNSESVFLFNQFHLQSNYPGFLSAFPLTDCFYTALPKWVSFTKWERWITMYVITKMDHKYMIWIHFASVLFHLSS